MNKNLFLLILSIFVFSGCLDSKCVDMQFERLSKTDKILITDNMNQELRAITDKATINKIVDFAMSHKTKWATPWYGTPVSLLRANFYSKGDFIGDLGIGSKFITAQGCGYFQSRDIAAKDREIIIDLFGVSDPYLE